MLRKRANEVSARLAVACLLLVAVSGCAEHFDYYAPSASEGHVDLPFIWTHGDHPKDHIYFSPRGLDYVWIIIHASRGCSVDCGVIHPEPSICIELQRLGYSRNDPEIDVTAEEPSFIRVKWRNGERLIPLIPNQKLKVAAGDCYPLPSEAVGQALDVKFPTLSFNGTKLEFPLIHFEPAEGDFLVGLA